MDHHSNQVYYVLDHKTERIRDVYTLGRMLGQSHFGTTYLSTEIATRVDYACKSISKRKLISKEDLEDAMKEILLLHHLARHKNMVTIKGVYEDPLYVHIVMEHCNGGELFDRIIHREQYTEKVVDRDDYFSLKAFDFGLSVYFRPGQVFTDVLYILLRGVPPFWAGTCCVLKSGYDVKVLMDTYDVDCVYGFRDLEPENFLVVDRDDYFSLKAFDFRLLVYFRPGQVFTDVLYILLRGVPPFWAALGEDQPSKAFILSLRLNEDALIKRCIIAIPFVDIRGIHLRMKQDYQLKAMWTAHVSSVAAAAD
ncbi:calcium-dependent protein kinase 26 [Tanacetum coccineum]